MSTSVHRENITEALKKCVPILRVHITAPARKVILETEGIVQMSSWMLISFKKIQDSSGNGMELELDYLTSNHCFIPFRFYRKSHICYNI